MAAPSVQLVGSSLYTSLFAADCEAIGCASNFAVLEYMEVLAILRFLTTLPHYTYPLTILTPSLDSLYSILTVLTWLTVLSNLVGWQLTMTTPTTLML